MKNAFAVFMQIAHLFQTGGTDPLKVAIHFEGRNYNLTAEGVLGAKPDGAVELDRTHAFFVVFQVIELLGRAVFEGNSALTLSYSIGDAGYFSLPITVQAI